MLDPFPVDVRPDALDWITAIGTGGATILALAAIWMQFKDRRQVAEDARRQQASLVSAWLDDEVIIRNDRGQAVVTERKVFVRNGSDQIIYRVWLHPVDRHNVQALDVGIVIPQTTWSGTAATSVGDPGTIPFELDFVDASGQYWTRYPDGRLVKGVVSAPRPAADGRRQPPEYRLF